MSIRRFIPKSLNLKLVIDEISRVQIGGTETEDSDVNSMCYQILNIHPKYSSLRNYVQIIQSNVFHLKKFRKRKWKNGGGDNGSLPYLADYAFIERVFSVQN